MTDEQLISAAKAHVSEEEARRLLPLLRDIANIQRLISEKICRDAEKYA